MGEALSDSLPNAVLVDETGTWWREYSTFSSLVPDRPKGWVDKNAKMVARYVLVQPLEPRNIIEGDHAAEFDFIPAATPPENVDLEDLDVGYESRWHDRHVAYVEQCADCRRMRRRGLR